MVRRKRIEWVDMAKGIAILLMIIGHEIPQNELYFFIFSFHMPLFFILSGYTSGKVDTWKKFWLKTKKSFIRVWLLAVVMIFLLSLEMFFLGETPLNKLPMRDLQGIYLGSNSAPNVSIMWFLITFFWAKILFDGLQVVFSNDYIGYILGIFAFFGYVISKHMFLPQDFDIVPLAAFFMWIGSLWNEMDNALDKNSIIYKLLLLGLFIFWIACIQNGISIEMALRRFPHFILCVMEAVAGTVIISYISEALTTQKLFNFLQVIGKKTLAILCIHDLDFYWIYWSNIPLSPVKAVLLRLLIDLLVLGIYMLCLVIFHKICQHRKQFSKSPQ